MSRHPWFPLFLVFGIAFPSLAAPDAKSWDRWSVHGKSGRKLDHVVWKDFLAKYLDTTAEDGCNRLRYGKVTAADGERLRSYLAGLEGETVSRLDRPGQKAYWINLYNARTAAEVLQAYPVASIREIKLSGIFDWYKEDFGTTPEKVVGLVSRYAAPVLRKTLAESKGGIKYQHDWKLNDAGPGR